MQNCQIPQYLCGYQRGGGKPDNWNKHVYLVMRVADGVGWVTDISPCSPKAEQKNVFLFIRLLIFLSVFLSCGIWQFLTLNVYFSVLVFLLPEFI